MKTLGQAIAVIAVAHLIGALALLGYLAGTHRLSGARIAAVKNVFAMTVEQQRAAEEQATGKANEAEDEAAKLARSSGLGPVSAAESLAAQQERDEMMLRQLERTRREIEDLQRNLQLTRQRMEREKKELQTARDEAATRFDAIQKQLDDEGFRTAVQLYEQLPAKQVKQMFMTMVESQETEQVVAFLEAMEPRKAAGVLREFKAVHEVPRAVELMERLRARGSDLVKQLEVQS